MKRQLFIFLFLCLSGNLAAQVIDRDSTKEEKFIARVLKDYKQEGIWIFVKVDSLYLLPDNYEIIHPLTLFEAYKLGFKNFSEASFIETAFENLTNLKIYERYPESILLKGLKINMKEYTKLQLIPIDKILGKYFNADRTFKKEHCDLLNEVIAVCYSKQVQVITPKNGCAYYKILSL